jgi:NodT family efflux transporter outer membrane factor (OMF) lipoprotein
MTKHLLLLTLAIAGCRSTPPGAVEAVEVSTLLTPAEAWSSTEPTAALPVQEAFWSELGSPALDALVVEGLTASPTLAIAARRVEAAAAALEAAAGAELPSVQASLSTSRSRVNFVGLPVPGSSGVLTSESTSYGLSLGVGWEIDLWGRLASAKRGAAASLDAQSLDLVAARQSLAAQIAKASLALAEAHAARQFAGEALESAKLQLNNAARLVENGQGRAEDQLAAEARLAAARANATAAERREALLAPPLSVLLGRPAGRDALFDASFLDTLSAELLGAELPPPPAAGLPAELLARRPDLAGLEARVRAAQAGAEVARAALFPAISLTGSAGTSGSELQNLVDGNFQVWSLGANLLAPIFNGGRLAAAEDRAIADRDVALFAFAQAALLAFAEVDSALVSESLLTQQLAELSSWRDKLAETESLLANKNRRGSAPAAAVLAARSARISADTARLATLRERLTNRIDLYLALGGGFQAH